MKDKIIAAIKSADINLPRWELTILALIESEFIKGYLTCYISFSDALVPTFITDEDKFQKDEDWRTGFLQAAINAHDELSAD